MRRGFFRIWIVGSILWASWVVYSSYQLHSGMVEFDRKWLGGTGDFWSVEEIAGVAVQVFAPVIGVLLLGIAVSWIAHGFDKTN